MRESVLWARIKRHVQHAGDFVRIENSAGVGQPDVNYCIGGAEGWIELKHALSFPAREGTKVFGSQGLRTAQQLWIARRLRHGGRCFVVAQVADQLFMMAGDCAPSFNDMTRKQLEDNAVLRGGRQFDWQAFIDYLEN